MDIVKRDEESSSDNNDDKNLIADELEAMFSGKNTNNNKHSNLKKWKRIDKKERDEAGPEIPSNIEGVEYLGAELIEEDEETR